MRGLAPDAGVAHRLNGVTVRTVGSEPWRGSLSDRVITAPVQQCWRRIPEIALVTAAAYPVDRGQDMDTLARARAPGKALILNQSSSGVRGNPAFSQEREPSDV